MKPSKKIINAVFILMSPLLLANDAFDELDAEMASFDSRNADSQETENEFERYLQSQKSDYELWQIQYLKEFDQYQQEVIEKWGKVDPVQAEYDVEFSVDKNVKSVIDYENEEVKVELIIAKDLSLKDAEAAIKKQVDSLLADESSSLAKVFAGESINEKAKISVSNVEFSKANKQQSKEVIVKQTQSQAQQIDKKADRALLDDSLLTTNEATLLATQEKTELLKSSQARLQASESNYQQAEKNASHETKIVTYKVKLPKNSLQKRASKYVVFAEEGSKVNHIPAPLIMAIMHSESAFNPNAKSAVPAYGLMQIVPRTAGHDVNKLVRNIDKPMKAEDLYVPQINVETGSAYLNILDKRYLEAIQNDQSRLYCTIAAYNTGAGNVARVFNKDGSRNINKAAKVINKLSADEVYEQLLAKLPYDETKHYLERVNTRIALYQHE